ncbi:MAG: 6,7-dimethyl-8-ribityllumazine synthase [Candidatus Magasanikbacteria bacterium]|jgi:6,7-dimethyl-8-ribityllumazine synthase|nr:6,7-dimethyl-8-ribityllumazine synthase [Candidatus Magasanikbacteria bacterium]MBT4221416.1 6,7-dimethyl-8-ribityllumazine synthase [Candidatus Magasanikbacteria bacterium]MBT4350736.1 6,7-dimethyl-8-ribityllumazine synthase [Candidatus Magasanikbacteria bacterium]MBT4541588.1 6,7-dimethyl-8-ribityllumazine synthase [Candidatus Magasanikbacteria bacterium]MBT6253540.1 6,7-dimethyl-8-ribityllumazine synthase [Candidatus Magasanikbacteria bacterium]
MGKGIDLTAVDGTGLRIGLIKTRWNAHITDSLFTRCKDALIDSNIREEDIVVIEVPGAYELPLAAKHLIDTGKVDAVIPLGCLIKGETMHFEYIAEAITQGIMRLNLDTGIPVVFGVLTVFTEEQAIVRSTDDHNHGYEWGITAVEMALLRHSK